MGWLGWCVVVVAAWVMVVFGVVVVGVVDVGVVLDWLVVIALVRME